VRVVVAMADDEPKPKDSEDVINLVALRTEKKIQKKKRIRFSFSVMNCVRPSFYSRLSVPMYSINQNTQTRGGKYKIKC
jgi:hypothetical protein